MNCTAWNTTTPPLYSVAIRCIHYNSDNAISLDPDLNSKHNRLVGLGFMCLVLAVAGLASCFMWVPCYLVIDERVKHAVELAQAGQGVGTSVFDKSDCANPCRGCFKIIVLAVMTPCECRVYADGSENGRPLQGCALVHLLEWVGCVRTRAAVVRCRSCGHVYYPVNGKVRHAVLHSVVEQLLLCEHARSHQSCLHRIWTMPCRHRRVHWGGGWVPVQVPVPAAWPVYCRHV